MGPTYYFIIGFRAFAFLCLLDVSYITVNLYCICVGAFLLKQMQYRFAVNFEALSKSQKTGKNFEESGQIYFLGELFPRRIYISLVVSMIIIATFNLISMPSQRRAEASLFSTPIRQKMDILQPYERKQFDSFSLVLVVVLVSRSLWTKLGSDTKNRALLSILFEI